MGERERERGMTNRYESGDFLSILDELHTNAFSDCRIWLFSLYTDFFEHDAFGV
jgi:hypothetical protein